MNPDDQDQDEDDVEMLVCTELRDSDREGHTHVCVKAHGHRGRDHRCHCGHEWRRTGDG